MKWPDDDAVESVRDAYRRRDEPIPEHLFEPEIWPGDCWIAEAFWILSSDRPHTMAGPGPIPWTAVDRYAERCGVHEHSELYADLVSVLRKVDQSWLKERERQRKIEEAKKGGRRGKSGSLQSKDREALGWGSPKR